MERLVRPRRNPEARKWRLTWYISVQDLYENLALGNPEVAEFAYVGIPPPRIGSRQAVMILLWIHRTPTVPPILKYCELLKIVRRQSSADWDDSFAAEDISHRKPVTLTRAAYLELLEKNGVSPGFIEVFANNNGACIGSPTYSNGEDYPGVYRITPYTKSECCRDLQLIPSILRVICQIPQSTLYQRVDLFSLWCSDWTHCMPCLWKSHPVNSEPIAATIHTHRRRFFISAPRPVPSAQRHRRRIRFCHGKPPLATGRDGVWTGITDRNDSALLRWVFIGQTFGVAIPNQRTACLWRLSYVLQRCS